MIFISDTIHVGNIHALLQPRKRIAPFASSQLELLRLPGPKLFIQNSGAYVLNTFT